MEIDVVVVGVGGVDRWVSGSFRQPIVHYLLGSWSGWSGEREGRSDRKGGGSKVDVGAPANIMGKWNSRLAYL